MELIDNYVSIGSFEVSSKTITDVHIFCGARLFPLIEKNRIIKIKTETKKGSRKAANVCDEPISAHISRNKIKDSSFNWLIG